MNADFAMGQGTGIPAGEFSLYNPTTVADINLKVEEDAANTLRRKNLWSNIIPGILPSLADSTADIIASITGAKRAQRETTAPVASPRTASIIPTGGRLTQNQMLMIGVPVAIVGFMLLSGRRRRR